MVDVYAEWRAITNGALDPDKDNFADVVTWVRSLKASPQNDGCAATAADLEALEEIFASLLPRINLRAALLRGRYMIAVARMMDVGVPVDGGDLRVLRRSWRAIRTALLRRVDADYGVFSNLKFDPRRWADWLERNAIDWPRTPSGELELELEVFRDMARCHPTIIPLWELLASLYKLRLSNLTVGHDGRNRCCLNPFRARTSRNQPRSSEFILGGPVWVRGLIRPEAGRALAHLDWVAQEVGVAAALSGDSQMQRDYRLDAYVALGRHAGLIPPEGARETHPEVREIMKSCFLGIFYSMGVRSLAARVAGVERAEMLLAIHKRVYGKFWDWADRVVRTAIKEGQLETALGWRYHVGADPNRRSLRNFPIQSAAAEILRLACCFATEAGVRVCAPIHDALLIEAELEELEDAISLTQEAMRRASELVLDGFALDTDVKIVRYPDHFRDKRGAAMWNMVWEEVERSYTEVFRAERRRRPHGAQ